MKILKEGKLIDTDWIGQCNKCDAIISANIKEIGSSYSNDRSDCEDFSWKTCEYCWSNDSVCFHRKHSQRGKELLAEYNKEKKCL